MQTMEIIEVIRSHHRPSWWIDIRSLLVLVSRKLHQAEEKTKRLGDDNFLIFLPETNIFAPENNPLEKGDSYWKPSFLYKGMLVSRRVYPKTISIWSWFIYLHDMVVVFNDKLVGELYHTRMGTMDCWFEQTSRIGFPFV